MTSCSSELEDQLGGTQLVNELTSTAMPALIEDKGNKSTLPVRDNSTLHLHKIEKIAGFMEWPENNLQRSAGRATDGHHRSEWRFATSQHRSASSFFPEHPPSIALKQREYPPLPLKY